MAAWGDGRWRLFVVIAKWGNPEVKTFSSELVALTQGLCQTERKLAGRWLVNV